MKRFYVSSGALVVGILLAGAVHAGPPRSSHHAGSRSRLYSGHYRKAPQPRLRLLPRLRIPEQPPGWWGYDPDSGGYAPSGGTEDPNAVDYDPYSGAYPPGGGIDSGNVARPPVIPNVGGQRGTEEPDGGTDDAGAENPNRPSQISGPRPRR
jgi:hypothetical protein